jgi:putative ubiquitin-RnfH superfamily antitoxin RatB of RatAB toxin-antitoxin module
MVEALKEVEVVYAAVDRQVLLSVAVPAGTTVRAALVASGIGMVFPDLDLAECPVGIFGKVITDPDTRAVQSGIASRFIGHCSPIRKRFDGCVRPRRPRPDRGISNSYETRQ